MLSLDEKGRLVYDGRGEVHISTFPIERLGNVRRLTDVIAQAASFCGFRILECAISDIRTAVHLQAQNKKNRRKFSYFHLHATTKKIDVKCCV